MPFISETSKHRNLVFKYCGGMGVDIGSGGDPVCEWAIQIDLPFEQRMHYNPEYCYKPIHLEGDGRDLYWFRDGVLSWAYSSHLLEDYADWNPVLREWMRVVKVGGYLIILIPDKQAFAEAVAKGQPPNLAHQHEGYPGELTEHVQRISADWEVLEDRLVKEVDYSILFVARRIR
jgi:predicted SAM-dependent methyltransferase